MRIEYQNVDIAQEEHVILKGVNFQAEAGEFVYLIGKVGTGKSSLLKTFYGELDVHTGSARVLDREMTKSNAGTSRHYANGWVSYFRISSCLTTVPYGPIWISYSKRPDGKRRRNGTRAFMKCLNKWA